MRPIVINAIIDLADMHDVPNLEHWNLNAITRKELELCSDEDLVEILVYVATYDGEDE